MNAILRPDSKGKISFGSIPENVSGYKMTIEDNGKIILEPQIEISYADKWIFEDKELIEKARSERKQKSVV